MAELMRGFVAPKISQKKLKKQSNKLNESTKDRKFKLQNINGSGKECGVGLKSSAASGPSPAKQFLADHDNDESDDLLSSDDEGEWSHSLGDGPSCSSASSPPKSADWQDTSTRGLGSGHQARRGLREGGAGAGHAGGRGGEDGGGGGSRAIEGKSGPGGGVGALRRPAGGGGLASVSMSSTVVMKPGQRIRVTPAAARSRARTEVSGSGLGNDGDRWS
eukprot:gene1453-1666_t